MFSNHYTDNSQVLDAVIPANPVPVFTRDADQRITMCISPFRSLLGKNDAQIIGRTIDELCDGPLKQVYAQADRKLKTFGYISEHTFEMEIRGNVNIYRVSLEYNKDKTEA